MAGASGGDVMLGGDIMLSVSLSPARLFLRSWCAARALRPWRTTNPGVSCKGVEGQASLKARDCCRSDAA